MIIFNKLSCHVKSHLKALEFEATTVDRQDLHTEQQAPLPAMMMLSPGEEAKKDSQKSIQVLQASPWVDTRRHPAQNLKGMRRNYYDMNMQWVKEKCFCNITCEIY